jgi:KDO2-lipid IV(A) lauroyltransferase
MRLLLFLMWLLHWLPLPILGRLGYALGWLFYFFMPYRRHITLTNLHLCFPHLNETEVKNIAKKHFQLYVRSILERAILWWGSKERLLKLIHINPAFPFKEVNKGPVIFLCPHFVNLDVAGTAMTLSTSICSVYTTQRNPIFNQILKKGRSRFNSPILLSRDEGIKPILRSLKEGHPFFMLPDMDFGLKNAEFIPFFNVPAATLTALSRIAHLANAKVIPIIPRYLPNYQGWEITFYPPWEDFPSHDIIKDTQRMNTFIEERILEKTAEYFWTHRRFKTRPPGENNVYPTKKK